MARGTADTEGSLIAELGFHSSSNAALSPSACTELAFFTGQSPQLTSLRNPRELLSLKVVQQRQLGNIPGLSALTSLTELWVVECQLQTISGLDSCRCLRKLLLYDNKFEHVPSLGHPHQLEILDLSCNQITAMASLETLHCLRELNLAGNPIQAVDERLSELTSLSYLNLAATAISSLGDLWYLSFFPALRSLLFSDPLYGPAALSQLPHYRSSALRSLTSLQTLDGIQVLEEERQAAAGIWAKKRVFYSMRRRSLQQEIARQLRKVLVNDESRQQVEERLQIAVRHSDLELESAGNIRFVYGLEQQTQSRPPDAINDLLTKLPGCQIAAAIAIHNKALQLRQAKAAKTLPSHQLHSFFLIDNSLALLLEIAEVGFCVTEQPVVLHDLDSLAAEAFEGRKATCFALLLQCAFGELEASQPGLHMPFVLAASRRGRAVRLLMRDLALPTHLLELTHGLDANQRGSNVPHEHSAVEPAALLPETAFVLRPLSVGLANPSQKRVERASGQNITSQSSQQALESERRLKLCCSGHKASVWAPGFRNRFKGPSWFRSVVCLDMRRSQLTDLEAFGALEKLEQASFAGNRLLGTVVLPGWPDLLDLDLSENGVSGLEGLSALSQLTSLSLDNNRLSGLAGLQMPLSLKLLSVASNRLETLEGIASLENLVELYAAENQLSSRSRILLLQPLTSLMVLDFKLNSQLYNEGHALYACFFLPSLRVLDGVSITPEIRSAAEKAFKGRLLPETLAQHLGHSDFAQVSELRLGRLGLRSLAGVFSAVRFPRLHSLSLSNNELTQVSELASLKLLSHLDISGNPLHFKCSFANSGLPNALSAAETSEASQPGFTALQSLLLDACSIEKLTHLHLSCLTGLTALSLKDNQITTIASLAGLGILRKLFLDGNHIRNIPEGSLRGLSSLQELGLSGNLLTTLEGLGETPTLTDLDLSGNRLKREGNLTQLQNLTALQNLALMDTPFARQPAFLKRVLALQPNLKSVNGAEVTEGDRTAALEVAEPVQGPLLTPQLRESHVASREKAARISLKPAAVSLEEAFYGCQMQSRMTQVDRGSVVTACERTIRRLRTASATPKLDRAMATEGRSSTPQPRRFNSSELPAFLSAAKFPKRPSSAGTVSAKQSTVQRPASGKMSRPLSASSSLTVLRAASACRSHPFLPAPKPQRRRKASGKQTPLEAQDDALHARPMPAAAEDTRSRHQEREAAAPQCDAQQNNALSLNGQELRGPGLRRDAHVFEAENCAISQFVPSTNQGRQAQRRASERKPAVLQARQSDPPPDSLAISGQPLAELLRESGGLPGPLIPRRLTRRESDAPTASLVHASLLNRPRLGNAGIEASPVHQLRFMQLQQGMLHNPSSTAASGKLDA